MDLRPTDEQRLLRQTVCEFAEAEMASHTMEWDETQRFPDVKLTTIGEGTSEIQRLVIARLLQQRVS